MFEYIKEIDEVDIDCVDGMSNELIEHYESELGVKFGTQYRQFLREFGIFACDGLEIYGILPEDNDGIPSAIFVTKYTREDEEEEGREFPKDWVVVCESGFGGVECVDSNDRMFSYYFGDIEDLNEDFKSYLDRKIKEILDDEDTPENGVENLFFDKSNECCDVFFAFEKCEFDESVAYEMVFCKRENGRDKIVDSTKFNGFEYFSHAIFKYMREVGLRTAPDSKILESHLCDELLRFDFLIDGLDYRWYYGGNANFIKIEKDDKYFISKIKVLESALNAIKLDNIIDLGGKLNSPQESGDTALQKPIMLPFCDLRCCQDYANISITQLIKQMSMDIGVNDCLPNVIFIQNDEDTQRESLSFLALNLLGINENIKRFDMIFQEIQKHWEDNKPYCALHLVATNIHNPSTSRSVYIVYVKDDLYQTSLLFREQFENECNLSYPLAKWINDDALMLLYDSFMVRNGEFQAYIGGIEAMQRILESKIKETQKITLGYIDRTKFLWEEDEVKREVNRSSLGAKIGLYISLELKKVAVRDVEYPFSTILYERESRDKKGFKDVEIIFFSDYYDNDGQEYDNDYFSDAYLNLSSWCEDKLNGEFDEKESDESYGAVIIEREEEEADPADALSNAEYIAQMVHQLQTQPGALSALESMGRKMADAHAQLMENLEHNNKLDSRSQSEMRYAYKERDKAFMQVFELDGEEYDNLNAKDFEYYQKELDSEIIRCVEMLEIKRYPFEITQTQKYLNNIEVDYSRLMVEFFTPITNTEAERTIGFNSQPRKAKFKPNREYFFNLLRAGAEVDLVLVEKMRRIRNWYVARHCKRFEYHNHRNNLRATDEQYLTQNRMSKLLYMLPIAKILNDMVLALTAACYSPKSSRVEGLDNLARSNKMSDWIMPQRNEFFIIEDTLEDEVEKEILGYTSGEIGDEGPLRKLEEYLENGKIFIEMRDIKELLDKVNLYDLDKDDEEDDALYVDDYDDEE